MFAALLQRIRRFLSELRRRNVYQVAVTYVVVGFFVIEGADLTLTRLGLPPWTVTFVIVLVGLGFPIALVLAWALEMTPEGVRVEETAAEEAEGSADIPISASPTRDLWTGASVLVLLLLGAWWMWGDLGSGGADSEAESGIPTTQERSIAVLPFEVSGAGAEEWRDGMVTMLSMNLDGAAGLRAIADRTVFAAREKQDSAQVGRSTREALAIVRNVGAKYAVVGSAVQLGEELRLGAEVRRVDSGKPLGEVEVEGASGDITTLTDRLTREVLGVLLEKSKEQLPPVGLESLTTSSLPALKAYLAGERRYRAGKIEAAIQAYENAVERDSTFAMAYHQLALARWYLWAGTRKGMTRALGRAYALAGQLPRRERGMIRAFHLYEIQERIRAAEDTLRRLTEAYPDDPTIWYHLGEVLYHHSVPRGWPEADEAFGRAAELDPGMSSPQFHLIHLAFSLHRDSTLAAERIRVHPGFANPSVNAHHEIGMDLVFGGPKRRKDALAGVDTVAVGTPYTLVLLLQHPLDSGRLEAVLRRLRKRETVDLERHLWRLPRNAFDQGQVERALADLQHLEAKQDQIACLLARERSLGLPVPDSILSAYLEPSRVENGAPVGQLTCAGFYLITEGRGRELPALFRRIRKAGAAQNVSEARVRASLTELKAYRAWKAGEKRRAAKLGTGTMVSGYMNPTVNEWRALWRGELYRKLGQPKTAEGWYLAAWQHPVAHERLGQLYEEMGKPEKAAAAYERFIKAWEDADPELQNRVNTARRRVKELAGETAK